MRCSTKVAIERLDDKGWLAISGKQKHQDGDGLETGPSTGSEAGGLDGLRRRIRDAELNSEQKDKDRRSAALPAGAFALVGRVAIELVAGVAVGALIGWTIDKWLGTTPFFMIALLFLGAGGGMMNLWRMASGHGLKAGYFDGDANASKDEKDGDRG